MTASFSLRFKLKVLLLSIAFNAIRHNHIECTRHAAIYLTDIGFKYMKPKSCSGIAICAGIISSERLIKHGRHTMRQRSWMACVGMKTIGAAHHPTARTNHSCSRYSENINWQRCYAHQRERQRPSCSIPPPCANIGPCWLPVWPCSRLQPTQPSCLRAFPLRMSDGQSFRE